MRPSNKRTDTKPNPKPAVAAVPQVTNEPTPEPQPDDPGDIPEELIAQRAYEKWERRGCPMGQESSEEDWHAAREELMQERLKWASPQPDDRNRI